MSERASPVWTPERLRVEADGNQVVIALKSGFMEHRFRIPRHMAKEFAAELQAILNLTPPCDTEVFLLRMVTAALNGERVTAEDVAELRRLADWADAPPPPTWNGTLDKGETARAVAAARKRMEG